MGKNHRGKHSYSKRGGGNRSSRVQHYNSKPRGPKAAPCHPSNFRHRDDRPKERSLNETEIGVTQYLSDTKGFTGVIKSRFSDFQVNEIDLNGEVIHLTKQGVPDTPPQTYDAKYSNSEELNDIIPKETWQEIRALEESTKDDVVKLEVTDMEKNVRTSIHVIVREMFNSKVVSSTLDKDEKKFIIFKKRNNLERNDIRVKWTWPHEYVHFVVFKENIDTMQAAATIAPGLNMPPSGISYAGTKDKRAKTAQMFCVKKRQPSAIAKAASRISNIRVGNFTFKPHPLKLGNLNGNRFRIALRRISGDEDDIVKSLEQVKENGFINYYGLQRFGTCSSIPTYEIGLALIKEQFKEAVELILKPRSNDPDFLREIREFWMATRDAEAALKMFHKNNKSVEARLMFGLSKNGRNDYVNALAALPRNMRLLYIHSYQSLVWNEMASKRIHELGMSALVGDLVYVNIENDVAKDHLNEVDLDCALKHSGHTREYPVKRISETDDEDDDDAEEEEEPAESVSFKDKVRPLTEEDIKSGKYSIHDIVLPLPGHDITYPSNIVGQWYMDRLLQNELSPQKLLQKKKEYSLAGAYRKLLVKPDKMSWQFMKYEEDTDPLIQSDLEILQKKSLPTSVENGRWKALVLDFCLPSSTYATMALREILKADTSSTVQSEISVAQGKTQEKSTKDANIQDVVMEENIGKNENEDTAHCDDKDTSDENLESAAKKSRLE